VPRVARVKAKLWALVVAAAMASLASVFAAEAPAAPLRDPAVAPSIQASSVWYALSHATARPRSHRHAQPAFIRRESESCAEDMSTLVRLRELYPHAGWLRLLPRPATC